MKCDKNADFFFILEPDLHITFSEGGSVNSKWPVAVNNRN